MNSELILNVLSFAVIPVLAMITGGITTSYHPPKARLRSILHHFAAGVVFAVVAVEFLPDIMKEHNILATSIGFALGVTVMLGLKYLLGEKAGEKSTRTVSVSLFAGIGVDIFIDGLLIGIVFSSGEKAGKLLVFALAVEMLSLGMALASSMSEAKTSRRKTILMITFTAMLIFVGAGLGATILPQVSRQTLETVLSFGLAALLFLVTEELLVEAHEEPETPLITSTFFVGFLLFLILGMTI
jgi:zinc transporter, ZIP family